MIPILFMLPLANAFFFNHQQQPERVFDMEREVLDNTCADYLCPDTLSCVKSVNDCPCPFPKSQLRCVLPDKSYICISKPATHDAKLIAAYDDPVKGPKVRKAGLRDCGWVADAWKGLV